MRTFLSPQKKWDSLGGRDFFQSKLDTRLGRRASQSASAAGAAAGAAAQPSKVPATADSIATSSLGLLMQSKNRGGSGKGGDGGGSADITAAFKACMDSLTLHAAVGLYETAVKDKILLAHHNNTPPSSLWTYPTHDVLTPAGCTVQPHLPNIFNAVYTTWGLGFGGSTGGSTATMDPPCPRCGDRKDTSVHSYRYVLIISLSSTCDLSRSS